MKSAKKSSLKKKTKTAKPKRVAAPKAKKVERRLKLGIFGGNFDPFHAGHLNSLRTVTKALKLDEVRVIPAFQSPLRTPVHGSTPEQRLAMALAGIRSEKKLKLDDREIRRGGLSYTINTVTELQKEQPKADLYLIIGMDQFESFDKWKDFATLLEQVHLVVTSRPGREIPDSVEGLPSGVRNFVKRLSKNKAILQSGREIYFVQLDDVEVSATEIRRRLRDHLTITDLVPEGVAEFIQAHRLYETVNKTIGDFEQFTKQCAQWLDDRGGINIQAYDLRELNGPTEFTLIASGTSTRHASALAEFLSREVKTHYGVWPQATEGLGEGRWVVVDYGSLIIHIFYDFVRQEYKLEQLWSKGKQVQLEPSKPRS